MHLPRTPARPCLRKGELVGGVISPPCLQGGLQGAVGLWVGVSELGEEVSDLEAETELGREPDGGLG